MCRAGFFHSGTVKYFSPPARPLELSYVYDCGSKKGATQRDVSIESFKGSASGSRGDFLFISHLDQDHVNGLTVLLRNFHFDYVVLPLFPWQERLIRAAAHISRTASSGLSGPDDAGSSNEWYLALLSDPRAALESLAGAGSIIELSPTAPDPDENQSVRFRPNAEWNDDADPSAPPLWMASSTGPRMADNASWIFGPSDDEEYWTFLPHVDPGILHNTDTFQKELCNSLPQRQDGRPWDFSDNSHLEEVLGAEKLRRLMKRSYEAAAPSVNGTSLTLLSTLTGDVGSGGAWKLRRSIHTTGAGGTRASVSREMWYGRKGAVGWLGLGDSDMSGQSLSRRASTPLGGVLSCFSPFADAIHTIAIPHHGSVTDFSDDLLTTFQPVVCVASAAASNKYGHPHPDVVSSIADYGARFVFVTEGRSSEYNHVFELERI